jgi:hypothetical protein
MLFSKPADVTNNDVAPKRAGRVQVAIEGVYQLDDRCGYCRLLQGSLKPPQTLHNYRPHC